MSFGGTIDGQALTEMELVFDGGQPVSLTQGRANYSNSVLTETVGEPAVYRHQMVTLNPSVVDKVIKASMSSGTPYLRFRLGFGNPDVANWLPWQEHTIVGYAAMLESLNNQSGHAVDIETRDALHVMSAANRTVARRGSISEIVTQIATANDLDAVVEPTLEPMLIVQSFMDDTEFIRDRLVPRALNAKNRGNYLFFIKDGVLHFHTPDYQTTIKELVYYRSTATQLTQVDNTQRLFNQGNAGVVTVVYDPYTGAAQQVFSVPDNALKLADGSYTLPESYTKPICFTLGENRTGEAVAIGQNMYSVARSGNFELVLRTTKMIDIRLGDLVKLVINPREGTATVWSGVYLVTKLVYDVNKGAVNSTIQLTRGEIGKDQANNSVESASQQLVPREEASGQRLNVQEVLSSQKTKGAGKQTSSGLFIDVQSPN